MPSPRTLRFFALLLLLSGTCLTQASANIDAESSTQDSAISEFITLMVNKHAFGQDDLTRLMGQSTTRNDILRAIANPAEAKPWYRYRPIFVTSSRIREGVRFWQENRALLQRAQETYGVPPEIIVAIIGVETRYGRHAGKFRVLDSLATLAFNYPPRSSFFRSELEQFLLLTREEQIDPLQPYGSYAGAMGKPQFISSSYRQYAVDFDNDGKRDLWNNNADAIGSVAHYFARHGWQPNEPVTTPATIYGKGYREVLELGLKPQLSIYRLSEKGIKPRMRLPETRNAALIKLDTRTGPEYWIGLKNFYVITRYNHSALYAMAVYQLSQEINSRMQEGS